MVPSKDIKQSQQLKVSEQKKTATNTRKREATTSKTKVAKTSELKDVANITENSAKPIKTIMDSEVASEKNSDEFYINQVRGYEKYTQNLSLSDEDKVRTVQKFNQDVDKQRFQEKMLSKQSGTERLRIIANTVVTTVLGTVAIKTIPDILKGIGDLFKNTKS